MAATYDVCPWPIDETCLPPEWADVDPDIQDRSIALASATLHRLTGYRVGGCPVTVRPCKESCRGGALGYWAMRQAGGWQGWWPSNWAGVWINGCGCVGDCSCTQLCEVDLPGPVGDVIEVKVDGDVVDPAEYRLDGTRLVWTGTGDCPWPACQDMAKPDDQPDTFAITYLNSWEPDGMGAYAAGVLAWEFTQACLGNKCRLPATVTAVSRQGITYEVTAGSFPNGTTGIREVDAYIGLWNPNQLRQEPQVWSPDLHAPRVPR